MHANGQKMLLIAQVIRFGSQQKKFKWHLLQKSFLHCHVEDIRPLTLSQSDGAKRIASTTPLLQMNLFDEFSFAYSARILNSYIFVHITQKNDATFLLVPSSNSLFFVLKKGEKMKEKFILIFCTFSSKFHSCLEATNNSRFSFCDLHTVEITCHVSVAFLRISFAGLPPSPSS